MREIPAPDDAGRRIQAVQTSCEILGALQSIGGGGVSDVAEAVGCSKTTAHSHLATLLDNEFVVKRGDRYDVSLRFVDMGGYATEQVEIYDPVVDEVERLAEETGEVAQFMVEEHGRGVYLHKAAGENAIQTASYVGARKDLHATALGKAILSQLSAAKIDRIVDYHGLTAHTDRTVTTRGDLGEEVDAVREAGVAFDDEEILHGLRCVAAPIQYPDSDIAGAISVSGPTTRFKGERFHEELPEIVRGAANVIEVNASQL